MTMHIEYDDGTIRPAVETFQWRLEQRIAELEAALAERTKERDDLAHDVERHLNIAVSAEMDRDAAIKRAEAAEQDAARLDWIDRMFFERHWSGTLGEPSYWTMAGPFRHALQRMRGKDLRAAIDAARGDKP